MIAAKLLFLVSLIQLQTFIVSPPPNDAAGNGNGNRNGNENGNGNGNDCDSFVNVGCFKDNYFDRVLTSQLIPNTRDPTNPVFNLPLMDETKWRKSLKSLACKCAKSARKEGYQHFALQFYGECWAGDEDYERLGVQDMSHCAGPVSPDKTCDMNKDKYCVGKNETNFVYKLEKVCNKAVDVGFVVDSSGSITDSDFKKTLTFIRKITNEFDVKNNGAHFAAISFSTKMKTEFSFDDSNMYKPNKLNKAIKQISKLNGKTYTKAALTKAKDDFFCPKCGSRQNVPKVLVLFSDGKSNDPSTSSAGRKTFKQITAPLKKEGVRIISVGVGPKVDMNEMNEIATNATFVLKVENYERMRYHLNEISNLICN